VIEGLEEGLVAVKKDRDAKKVELEALRESSEKSVRELQVEVQRWKGELAAGGGGIWDGGLTGGKWPFPYGWPFPNSGG
jgi:hypothetical protein